MKLLQNSFISLLVLVLAFNCLNIHAQKASLSGYVKDVKKEEPLIGVTVRLEGTETGGVTDLNGFYKITNIEPQTYNITVSYVGYQSLTKYNIVIRSGGNPDVNFDIKEVANELDGVVITSSPFRATEETPLSINRLSREEIATYPGGNNDIVKVAQSLPGVGASVGGFRNDLIIRGGAPNEVVYYLDGVEIPTINHFSTQGSSGGPVGLLNVSFFEGVTLSTSAFAAKYGNALSGVLQFDQRRGNDRNFQGNFRVSSSEAAFTAEGPILKKGKKASNTSYIASVRRSYLQLLFQALDLPFLPDYWDYQFKVNHKLDEYNSLNFVGVGSVDDFSVNVLDEFDPEQQAELDQVPIITQWSNTFGVSWRKRFKDGSGFLQTTLSQNILNNNFRQFVDNTSQDSTFFENNAREWENKLRTELTKFKGDWTLSAGAGIQQVNYTNSTINNVDNVNFDTDLDFWRYGVFGQASRSFNNGRLTASLGLRFDGNTFTDNGNEIWRTLSPRASISYALDDAQQWRLNASAGRYYKIPPYTILGFQNNAGVFTNQSAEYQRSDHLVLGAEYLPTPSLKVSLEGFYKRYTDFPVSVLDSVSLANLGGDFEVFGNEDIESVGEGRSFGLELLIQQKFTKNFYAILAYTLFASEFTGFDDEFLPSFWDSRNLLTFTGGYKFKRNWELSARVRYQGRTPFAPVDQEASLANFPAVILDFAQLGDVRLSTFNSIDLRIDKKWNFPKWTFNVFLDIENVLGSEIPNPPLFGLNRSENGSIIEPRSLVEIEGIDNGQILPSLGVIIDF